MSKFKVGDRVRCIDGESQGAGWILGKVFTIGVIWGNPEIVSEYDGANGVWVDSLELVGRDENSIEAQDFT